MNSKEELELVKEYIIKEKGRLNIFFKCAFETIEQDLDRLEKLEKAIEILRTKEVSIKWLFYCINLDRYNSLIDEEEYKLTEEQYNLLKEVLGNVPTTLEEATNKLADLIKDFATTTEKLKEVIK